MKHVSAITRTSSLPMAADSSLLAKQMFITNAQSVVTMLNSIVTLINNALGLLD